MVTILKTSQEYEDTPWADYTDNKQCPQGTKGGQK